MGDQELLHLLTGGGQPVAWVGLETLWRDIDTYLPDADGFGKTVPVAWKSGSRIARMANGSRDKDGRWHWRDDCANEAVEPPDYWFDLPDPPRGK